ncbi:MAG: ABC transporter ATP-binding protein [Candidatus Thalassarchaeaceae archaeon]|jgi:sodium transport system ATP-binding protein|nr:ABC transporter ATP-binding protein [Candidatus Thalassarchaeaceae archaeon]
MTIDLWVGDMVKTLLKVSDVTKSFADVTALSTVSVDFHAGEVVGLVGGNGAGKTTLLRLLCGLYQPTSGTVQGVVDEQPVDIHRMREHVGVVPEATGLYARLTAWENIRYHSRLNGIDDDMAWTRTERFAKLLNFDHDLHRSTRGFSRGMRQKTALLRALSHGPEILLLDEPTGGLDVTSARMVRKLVRKLGDEGGTVIYSTHNLAEAQQVCDRIIIIHNGTIRADGAPEELMSSAGRDDLEEAYVALTDDVARTDAPAEDEGRIARAWRRMLTRGGGSVE